MPQKYNISWIIYLKNNIYLKNTSGYIIILYLCNTNLNDMTYSFWDIEYGRLKMVTLIKSFFALLLPKTKKIRILKKMKKWLEISSFYICVPKITIKNETTQNIKIFEKLKRHLDISSFYTCAPSMKICFLRYKVQQTEFFVILGHFLPFHPTND